MRRAAGLLAGLALALAAAGPLPALEPRTFDSPAEEARYRDLLQELRCLVCQNQTLADSNADLAQDLRREVYDMVRAGRSDPEIIEFLVARYGDFVLYRPPVAPKTWLLWFGPFLVGAGAVAALVVMVRRRRRAPEAEPLELDEGERVRIAALLREDEEKPGR